MICRAVLHAVLLVFAGWTIALSQSGREREILKWQDERRGVDSLVIRLSDPKAAVRKASALALGNIQDTACVAALAIALHDKDSDIRRTAAFALGQMSCGASEQALLASIPSETNKVVQSAMLDALGRCGGVRSLDSAVAWLVSRRAGEDGSANSFLRFSIRGVRSEAGIHAAFAMLKNRDPEVRWRAMSALSRWSPHGAVDSAAALHAGLLATLVDDRSPDVRMHLATFLGRLSAKGSVMLLQQMTAREPKRATTDWRVQVNLARALVLKAQRDVSVLPTALSMLSVKNDHVKIAALQALEQLPPAVIQDTTAFARLFNRAIGMVDSAATEHEQVRGEAFVLLGRLNAHDVAEAESYLSLPETSTWMKTKLLEAFGQQATPRNMSILLKYLDAESIRVATAAWDYVKGVMRRQLERSTASDSAVWQLVVPLVVQRAEMSLRRNDMAVSTVVAAFFADTILFRRIADAGHGRAVRRILNEALGRMSSDVDVEAMQAVISTLGVIGDSSSVPLMERLQNDADRTVVREADRALQRLTGRAPAPRQSVVLPKHVDYDWPLLNSVVTRPRAVLVTNKGRIEMELLPMDAPFTVTSFVRLAKKGFFDGLTFHRVVPNFVVQGGDPRGDGWGGPGYSIRTEVSARTYERGSVGVASAGKDTEGCQFFITHCATPHLDGRYTIFARVVKGMDVVDRLQIGDRIDSVRVE